MTEPDWARPVVHWEIRAANPEKQKSFYAELFNWNIGDGRIMNIPAGIGGPEPGPGGHIMPSETPGVVLYVQVRDLRASLDRAAELGLQVGRNLIDHLRLNVRAVGDHDVVRVGRAADLGDGHGVRNVHRAIQRRGLGAGAAGLDILVLELRLDQADGAEARLVACLHGLLDAVRNTLAEHDAGP